MKPLILHISHTPLVGATQKLAYSLNRFSKFRSVCLVARDYPLPLKHGFIKNAILWDPNSALKDEIAKTLMEEAIVIHIHNTLPLDYAKYVVKHALKAVFVYQVHSGLREGPLFFEHSDCLNIPFVRKLVIGQAHPRHYPGFEIVPNIVVEEPSLQLYEEGAPPRLLFAPPHSRSGRWNGKLSHRLNDALKSLKTLGLVESILPENFLAPVELFELRRSTHISIDEIVTGGFHQVSFEALATGNVCINRADYFAQESFRNAVGAEELPPFFVVAPKTCSKQIRELVMEPALIRAWQERSHDYFQRYMRPELLVKKFVEIYEDVAN